MSTIIRVKRRLDEEPQTVIVVNCKRQKTSDEKDTEDIQAPTVLQLSGTVKNQDDDAFAHCKSSLKDNLKSTLSTKCKQNVFQSIHDRIKEECLQNSKENRYKVVNLCRSNSQTNDVTIVDVETNKHIEECSTMEPNAQYVYDLYYTVSDDLGDIYDHDLVGVYSLSNGLIYGSHRDNGLVDSNDDSSEDSNAENNWRNDYPDEDPDDNPCSITEDDMLTAVQHIHLGDEDDLSSDDEEEGFIYSIDSEAAGFEEDIDDTDVNRYGERYARFKAHYRRNEHVNDVVDEHFYHDYDDVNDVVDEHFYHDYDDVNDHGEEASNMHY